MGFDKTLTPSQLTPYWPPYWPPIKSMGKWKLKEPRTINETNSSSSINLAYLKLPRWWTRCRFPTLLFSFDCLVEVLLTEDRARISLNIIKYCFRPHWKMKQRKKLTNEQACERLVMDCSCEWHEHARKPQPEDEFHKVVPGLSPCFCILRTVVTVTKTVWTSPVDYFLLGACSHQKDHGFSG